MTEQVYRAALFSSAFESWRYKYRAPPLYFPTEALAARPFSIPKIISSIEASVRQPDLEVAARLIHRELQRHNHPDCDNFRDRCKMSPESDDAPGTANNPILPADNIEYDPETDVTDVTVWSVFRDVTRREAEHVIALAEPPNWKDASGDFFKEVVVGKMGDTEFEPEEKPERLSEEFLGNTKVYQFRETVEWQWAPQVDGTGGMINVLELDRRIAEPVSQRDHMKEVLDAIEKELRERDRAVEGALGYLREACSNREDSTGIETHYKYRLVCCLQSKFVSTWSLGGLDLDDGTYRALWCPYQKDQDHGDYGALFTKVQKSLHYTAEANAFPAHSKVLNAMAPALGSMFLKECAFHSVIRELAKLRSRNLAGSPTDSTAYEREGPP